MSIRKRKLSNGKCSYQAVLERGVDSTGKRIRDTKTFNTKKEAELYLSKQKSALNDGTYIEPSKMTVAQALDDWMENQIKPNRAPSTYSSYKVNVENHIKPQIGHIELQKLSPSDVQALYKTLINNKDLSERSIRYIRDNLHSCLKRFVNAQVIPRNVCEFTEIPKARPSTGGGAFYTPNEVNKLINAVRNDRFASVVYLGLVGLRRSEIAALTWNDINFNKKVIYVNKNYVVTGGEKHIGSCKTKSSVRTVAVPATIMNYLKEYKENQKNERAYYSEEYKKNNLVICKLNGDYINPASLSSKFPDILKKYDLRKIRLHDLRHTYCSISINYCNTPVATVARQVGHSSSQITNRYYSHSNDELQEASAAKFEEALFGGNSKIDSSIA